MRNIESKPEGGGPYINPEDHEISRNFAHGLARTFDLNCIKGVPPYTIVSGTLHALAYFIAHHLREGTDADYDGMTAAFQQLLEKARRDVTMIEKQRNTER